MSQFTGSRKKILDLIESPTYLKDINAMIKSAKAKVESTDKFLPLSKNKPKKPNLNNFLAANYSKEMSAEFLNWWLKHPGPSAITPMFDIISTCTIDGKKGILLVEGRVNTGELFYNSIKKILSNLHTDNVMANQVSVENAINEANTSISKTVKDIKLSTENCYQLSSRITEAWWLASKGIPVVLLYVGFLNYEKLSYKTHKIFTTDAEWQDLFKKHTEKVGVDKLLEKSVNCGAASFTTIVRSI